jgi:hypothetical protein
MSSGTKKQRLERLRRRRADMTNPAPPRSWVAAQAASSDAWDESFSHPLPLLSAEWECQVYQRTRLDPETGRLVDFATAIQVRSVDADEGWIDIERVDCAHGEVHVDRTGPNGKTQKDYECVPEDCRDNLDRAFRWGVEYVWDTEVRLKGWI